MKILSLITHFQHVASWKNKTKVITDEIPSWGKIHRTVKAWKLAKIAPKYDCIIFFYDSLLLFIFCQLFRFRHPFKEKPVIIFTTFLCDVSRFNNFNFSFRGLYDAIRKLYYRIFINLCDKVVVHSTKEILYYADTFKVSINKFHFIPYFVRSDALVSQEEENLIKSENYIITAGRHRDLLTFINALKNSEIQGIIVCGASDRKSLPNKLPDNISIFIEIPFHDYRKLIRRASIVVVPLFRDKWIRSLGQIVTFEAIAKGIPVVASKSFQLTDYFISEEEILFFEPGDAEHLRRQLHRIQTDETLRNLLTASSYNKMMKLYTPQIYTSSILKLAGNIKRPSKINKV